MFLKGTIPKGSLRSGWEQQVEKNVKWKEEHVNKLRKRNYGKTGGAAWLSDDPHEVESLRKKKGNFRINASYVFTCNGVFCLVLFTFHQSSFSSFLNKMSRHHYMTENTSILFFGL
jgi:hypothetical protein